MHIWAVSDDFLLYAISFYCDVVLMIYLDIIAGFKWLFSKVLLVPHFDLDPTLSRDHTFIWIFESP